MHSEWNIESVPYIRHICGMEPRVNWTGFVGGRAQNYYLLVLFNKAIINNVKVQGVNDVILFSVALR